MAAKPKHLTPTRILVEHVKASYHYAIGTHGGSRRMEPYWSIRSLTYCGDVTHPRDYTIGRLEVSVHADQDLPDRDEPLPAVGVIYASGSPTVIVSVELAAFRDLVSLAPSGTIKAIQMVIDPLRWKKARVQSVSFLTEVNQDDW